MVLSPGKTGQGLGVIGSLFRVEGARFRQRGMEGRTGKKV